VSSEWLIAAGSAFWLGILTSISPCPLATNIAAISFISRRVNRAHAVLGTGLLYACGRTIVYVLLAVLLVGSVLSAPSVSHLLQKYMNKALGPLLILVGMVLLGLIQIRTRGTSLGDSMGERAQRWGVWGGLLLGVVFALAFCPASAALYFGSLLPISIRYESPFFLPAAYGVGTALPVVLFAVAIAAGAGAVGKAFQKVSAFERWARIVTGAVFVLVGVYFCLVFIFRLW
jgi:cytochrome c biogenesis protein CcdA